MGRFVFNLLFLEGNQAFVLDASASVSRESSEYSGSSLDGDDADEINESMQPHQAISAHNITSPKGRRAVDMFDEFEFVEPQHAQDVFIQKVASPPRGRNIADLFDESERLDLAQDRPFQIIDLGTSPKKRRTVDMFDESELLDDAAVADPLSSSGRVMSSPSRRHSETYDMAENVEPRYKEDLYVHQITSPKGRRHVDAFDEYEFVEPQHAQDVFIQKVASPPRGRNIADLFDESQQLDDARIQKSKRRLSECFDASEELDSC
jgi:hypothetical protein